VRAVTRAEKARRIEAILDEVHPSPAIPLNHRNPFTLLVAVLLSAQTTDEQVNKVTPALFDKADNPRAMARLGPAGILRYVRTCGLAPTKAKNIAALSKLLLERHGGEVPRSLEELEALPGVGHKTASAVMAQAFGIPAFPVDTHIHRLAARWGLSSGKNVEQTERDLKSLFPPELWGKLHLQIIYFGRQQCPARGHDLSQCRICGWAASRARIRQESPRRGKVQESRAKKVASRR
jgi:endonuclease-3